MGEGAAIELVGYWSLGEARGRWVNTMAEISDERQTLMPVPCITET
jgi:hypothetical protein